MAGRWRFFEVVKGTAPVGIRYSSSYGSNDWFAGPWGEFPTGRFKNRRLALHSNPKSKKRSFHKHLASSE
jgi:hypothetical protein